MLLLLLLLPEMRCVTLLNALTTQLQCYQFSLFPVKSSFFFQVGYIYDEFR